LGTVIDYEKARGRFRKGRARNGQRSIEYGLMPGTGGTHVAETQQLLVKLLVDRSGNDLVEFLVTELTPIGEREPCSDKDQ